MLPVVLHATGLEGSCHVLIGGGDVRVGLIDVPATKPPQDEARPAEGVLSMRQETPRLGWTALSASRPVQARRLFVPTRGIRDVS